MPTVQQKFQQTLNELVQAIAESYEPLITGDIPDDTFETAVGGVATAKEAALSELMAIAETLIVDTSQKILSGIETEKVEKASTVSKMIPKEPVVSETIPVDTTAAPAAVPGAPATTALPTARAVLEGPAAPLPQDVAGGGSALVTPPGAEMKTIMENVANNAANVGMGGGSLGGMIDMDDGPVDHPKIHMTMAEEKRQAMGLPIKLKRPHVHVDHQGVHELGPGQGLPTSTPTPIIPDPTTAPAPTIPSTPSLKDMVGPKTAPDTILVDTLHQIQDIMIPYREDLDKTLSGVACAVLALINDALDPSSAEEAPRYEGMAFAWETLSGIVQAVRRLKVDIGHHDNADEIRREVSENIDLIMEAAANRHVEIPPAEPEGKVEAPDA